MKGWISWLFGTRSTTETAAQDDDLQIKVENQVEKPNLPSDLKSLFESGLGSDAPQLPSLQQTTQALKQKYGFGTDQASENQEARLRALLKGKMKAPSQSSPIQSIVAPAAVATAESQSDTSSDDDSDASSTASSSDLSIKARTKKRTKADSDMEDGSDEDDFNLTPAAKKLKQEALQANLPKTDNEIVNPPVPEPPVQHLPVDVSITVLGTVQSIVHNVLVIQAASSGDSAVLDAGTLVCLSDRSVLGEIFETFGPVQSPCYSVRFASPDSPALLRCPKGTDIFYPPHSSYASLRSTKDLREKGSDASNIYDEEPQANEIEFSDDEAEAAYKRDFKAQKHSRRQANEGTNEGDNPDEIRIMKIDGDLEYEPLSRPNEASASIQSTLLSPKLANHSPTLPSKPNLPATSTLAWQAPATSDGLRQTGNRAGRRGGRAAFGGRNERGRGSSDRRFATRDGPTPYARPSDSRGHAAPTSSQSRNGPTSNRGRGQQQQRGGGSRGRGGSASSPGQRPPTFLPVRPQFDQDFSALGNSLNLPYGSSNSYIPVSTQWQPPSYLPANSYNAVPSSIVPPLAELQQLHQTISNAQRVSPSFSAAPEWPASTSSSGDQSYASEYSPIAPVSGYSAQRPNDSDSSYSQYPSYPYYQG